MNQEFYEVHVPGERLYPEGTTIKIKKVTPFEQKRFFSLMSTAEEHETSKVLINFLRGLVTCDGISFDDLYFFDLQYLLYQIRAVTYKLFPLKVYTNCDQCGEKLSITIEPTELEIVELPEVVQKTVLLDNHGEIPIRPKKLKDDAVIDDFLKAQGFEVTDLAMRIMVMDLLTLSDWQPLPELWNMAQMGDITVEDTIRIEQYLSNTVWGVKEEVKQVCRHCGKEVVVSYQLDAADFFSVDTGE
jgi:hypothetical protein